MSQKSTTGKPKSTFAVDSYTAFRKTVAKSPIWDISPERGYKKYPNPRIIAPYNAFSMHKVVSLQEEKKRGKNGKNSFYAKFLFVSIILSIALPLVIGILIGNPVSAEIEPELQEKYSTFLNYVVFHISTISLIIVIILALIEKYPMVFHYVKNKDAYKTVEMVDCAALRQQARNKESWSDLYDLPLSMVITQGELCTQRVGEILKDIYRFSKKENVDTLDLDRAYDEYISSIVFLMDNLSSLPDVKIEEYKKYCEIKRKELLYQAEKLYNKHMGLQESAA